MQGNLPTTKAEYQVVLRDAYEEDAIRATALTSVRLAEHMDKFASWAMGTAGATVALMLGNIDTVISSIGRGYAVASLVLSLLSGLYGFAARFHSYQALMLSNLWGDAPERIAKIREKYEAEARELYGDVLPMRSDVIGGVVAQIVPASIDEMSRFGRVMWHFADWFLGLFAGPTPDTSKLDPKYHATAAAVFRATGVTRCIVWQVLALIAGVAVAIVGLVLH